MSATSSRSAAKAFTLLEVLVVGIVLLILLMITVPTFDRRPQRAWVVHCANNLRQINLALQVFASDHGDRFPSQVSLTNGGSMEMIAAGSPAPHFQTLSNEVPTPKVWICPTDKAKHVATSYVGLNNTNVSYFLSVDLQPTNTPPSFTFLAGDRHLQTGGTPVKPGLFLLTTNASIAWTRELHGNMNPPGGNIVFLDGHTEFLTNHRLGPIIRNQGIPTNRLAVP
ncbi:MAG TPA: type II secretion system protein [Verrucomicrobiae bacterium]